MAVILGVLESRESPMLKEIQERFKYLQDDLRRKDTHKIDDQRMKDMGTMVHAASFLLQALMEGACVDFKVLEESLTIKIRSANHF